MTHSEQQVGGTLTDSLLHEIMEPGYLPDISSLNVQQEMGYEGPFLEILEQPKSRGFRFRYSCEGPSHGGLPGEFSDSKNKSYPSVQLVNYHGQCRIVVSLVTDDEPHMPHAHSLTGKNANTDGVVTVQIGPEQGMTASFPNLGVQHVTKKKVAQTLTDRYSKMQALQNATMNAMAASGAGNFGLLQEQAMAAQGPFDRNLAAAVAGEESNKILKIVHEQAKSMNLSAVRLCFQAYLPDTKGNFTKPLKPCISQPVYDSKAPSACQLKICRMDKNSGCVTGGDEIYLLCDRVQKDDIEIRFYEVCKEDGKTIWQDFAKFAPADVHRQFAIVFKTPAYSNIAIEKPVEVLLELRRKSDKEVSEPFSFTYTPQMFDTEQIGAKRRKKVPHFTEYFPPGGPPGPAGGGSGGFGAGTGVLFDWSSLGNLPFAAVPSTSSQQSQGNTSGSTQNAPNQPSQELLKELALAIAEHSASAMRDFAATGDVRYLLSVQQRITAVKNDDGDTALHLAVINCQFSAVEGLVSVMKDLPGDFINTFNYLRQTPLQLAIITRQPIVTECLLRGNADCTLRDRHGNTPLHTACAQGNLHCVKVLMNRQLRKEKDGFPEIYWQNYNGYTPLHLAVIKGNREIVQILLSEGANREVKDGTCGRSPLHLAVIHDNIAIAGYLILEARCDVNSLTYDDNTPLHLAAGQGLESMTAFIVAAGADTMATNNEDETPYSLASTAEVKKILGGDEGPSHDFPTEYTEPVISKVAFEANKQSQQLNKSTDLLASHDKYLDAADSSHLDSGFGSQSSERDESESFLYELRANPGKILRPITDDFNIGKTNEIN